MKKAQSIRTGWRSAGSASFCLTATILHSVLTIILWFAGGLLREIAVRHGAFDLLLSQGFGKGILAIFLVWLVFRDEL
jgi:hypothetical protein